MKGLLVVAFVFSYGCKSKKSCDCEAPPAAVPRDFAGCTYDRRAEPKARFRCESSEGTWNCYEEQNRASCVWEGPLPAGHPLSRAERGTAEILAGEAK